MKVTFKLFALSLCLLPTLVFSSSKPSEDLKTKLEVKLRKINPAFSVESVDASSLEGWFEVQIESGPLLYVHQSADYMFSGTLFELSGGQIKNLTEARANMARKALMKDVKASKTIAYLPKPPMKAKAHIYIFTDIDCGYCRKLHAEVPELTEAGIAVHYLGFPRAGLNSGSYKKLATAWCSKNQNKAMDQLKSGQTLSTIDCQNPIAEQYELGAKMGVNGTPAILLEDGTLIPGYRPAKELIREILK